MLWAMDDSFEMTDSLPCPLQPDPMPMIGEWLDDAKRRGEVPNPDAMAIATVDADGQPAVRMVLCKGIDAELGRFSWYTNLESRKCDAIAHKPRVALLFFWDTLGRQVRIEGPTARMSDGESDAYFATRSTESKLGAWASKQSRPIESRDALLEKIFETMSRFGVTLDNMETAEIPRPPFWGGFHVWAQRVELWVGGPGRIHDRGLWTRSLEKAGDGYEGGEWESTRLQP
jgi:pyridoxamine 5'-phosphate oxidase